MNFDLTTNELAEYLKGFGIEVTSGSTTVQVDLPPRSHEFLITTDISQELAVELLNC